MELISTFPFEPNKDGDLTYKSLLSGFIEIKEAVGNKVKIRAIKQIPALVMGISATMGGKSIMLTVVANLAQIKRWCITDKDSDFKSDAGWGEELYALVETDPIMVGEKVHLHLLEYDSSNDSNYIKDLGEVAIDEKGIAKAKFTTNEIKTELNKLWNERNKYELFFAAEFKEGNIQFADVSRKNRVGKDTVYPATTVSHNGHEKAKFTYIDSKKDITSVRFLKSNGKDAYEVMKYGETIKLKVQTRNLEGTTLKLNLIWNKFSSGLEKIAFIKEFYLNSYTDDLLKNKKRNKFLSAELLLRFDSLSNGDNLELDYDPFIQGQDYNTDTLRKYIQILPLKNDNEFRVSFFLFGYGEEKSVIDLRIEENEMGELEIANVLSDPLFQEIN